MDNKPMIVVWVRQGVVEVYGDIAADVYIANEDILQGGSEKDVRKYHNTMAMIKTHDLRTIADEYSCSLCKAPIPWEKTDPVRGEVLGCEVVGCGALFCTACFTGRHGAEAYREMRSESDIFRCPDCWEQHVKARQPREYPDEHTDEESADRERPDRRDLIEISPVDLADRVASLMQGEEFVFYTDEEDEVYGVARLRHFGADVILINTFQGGRAQIIDIALSQEDELWEDILTAVEGYKGRHGFDSIYVKEGDHNENEA